MSSLKRNTRNKKETLMRKAEKPFCFIRVKADFKKKWYHHMFYLYHLKSECSAFGFSLKTQKNRKSIQSNSVAIR